VQSKSHPTETGTETGNAPDERSKWTQPALHRLKVSGAEYMQKKADDGVQGKGS
jgi:hypothetical protein